MGKGKRYNGEQKLNMKKVFAVIAVIALIVLFCIGIKAILKKNENGTAYFTEISYFTSYSNGKWGVISSKGENIIEPTYTDMITIPNNKKDIFLCMYEVNYSDNTYKTKAINSKNEQLYTAYNSVEALSNYDNNNNIWYEDNVLKVEKDGLFGLINFDGNEILPCEYQKIDTLKNVKNSILVQKDGLFGLVNNSGNKIIDTKYSSIEALNDDYNNGYIVKNSDGKLGVIATNKDVIFECKYSDIKHVYGNETYIVKENDKWQIVNKSTEKSVEINYEDVKSINSENIVIKNNSKYGIIATDKTEKVPCEYDDMNYAFLDYYIVKKDNKYGIINSKNEKSLELQYESLYFNKDADCLVGTKTDDQKLYLIDRNLQERVSGTNMTVHNGYIRILVDDQYQFYNLKFEQKTNREVFANNTLYVAKNDGKFGLVNKDGTLVVQYQYEDITEQNDYGYVAAKKDGKWNIIDQYGNTVAEYNENITDISKIQFIGKWHSIEDVNATYYICE